MNESIALNWVGPYHLSSPEGRASFDPPRTAGLYLWTVEEGSRVFRISYVGESSNISVRLYQHFQALLGGSYWLFESKAAQKSCSWDNAYQPKYFLEQFLGEFPKFAKKAYANLITYRFFWATWDGPQSIRRELESTIITAASEHAEPLQNSLPRASHAVRPAVSVRSILPETVRIPALKH